MWLPARYGFAIAAAAGTLAPLVARRPFRALSPAHNETLRATLSEVAVVSTLYGLWQYSGRIPRLGVSPALDRARWIVDAQQAVHLPSEKVLQTLILPHPWIVQAANWYYLLMHVPALGAALVWVFFAHRPHYRLLRNALALTTLLCLLTQLIPVAPPRLLPELGYVDTALKYNQSVYGLLGRGGLAGQVSAMPSIHVAWAAIVSWIGLTVPTRRWIKTICVAHCVLTVTVVAATANHFWMDGIVAVMYLAIAITVLWRVRDPQGEPYVHR